MDNPTRALGQTAAMTLEIATVVALSYLDLGERPGLITIVGAVLIIIGAATAPLTMRRRTAIPSTI